MDTITYLSAILLLIIPISHIFSYENNNPVIAITQGIHEKEGVLPISIYWYIPNFTEGNVLIVHHADDRRIYGASVLIEEHTGFYELPLEAIRNGDTPDDYCAVIKSSDGNFTVNSTCKSKVQWMYDLRYILKSFTLKELVIPGTHNSAAYQILDETSLWQEIGPYSAKKLMRSQTKSIKTQLMNGIRYLDLNPIIQYSNGRVRYLIIHNEVYLMELIDVVDQINEFMDLSNDIVIVSFKGFSEGFDSDDAHTDFIFYLQLVFLRHAHERTDWMHTLNDFWTAGKRLILSYDHEMHRSSRLLWPPIVHYWYDVQTINQLHSHLAAVHQTHAKISVPYAVLVDFVYSGSLFSQHFTNLNIGSQQWTERLSRYIPRWYTEEWNTTANIVLVNFYETSGIIDVAIQLNEKRAAHFQKQCHPLDFW